MAKRGRYRNQDVARGCFDRLIYGYYPDVVNHPNEEIDILKQLADSFLYKDIGAQWENWLISERKKWLHYHNIYANTYFWRTQDQQEIDYVEERDGYFGAYEIKWNPKAKVLFSKTFTKAYPQHHTSVVHLDNFYEFLPNS